MNKKGVSQLGFFHPRILFGVALCSIALLLGFLSLRAANSAGPIGQVEPQRESEALKKVAPWLLKQIGARQQTGEDLQSNGHAGRKTGQEIEALVILAAQADLAETKKLRDRAEKRGRVRELLWNKARQSQVPLLQWLQVRRIEYRPFYIVNAIWVRADAATILAISQRPDVLRIEGNPEIHNAVEPALNGTARPAESDTSPEPGISYTRAPEVWALGYTGQGVVVAGADTGQRWDHAALKNQYRGWDGTTANHDYNWHDSIHSGGGSCGHDSLTPCDDQGHGTHTIGTAVGDDGGANHIGMAPGARWIGCRNMDQGVGTPARYIECMEFFLAPYPVGGTSADGDPGKAPDITVNSWTCPASEGCSVNTLQAAVEAQRAAGIMMVAAAGNSGANCSTVDDPPAIYDAVYSIGALNNGTDTIASFSSRGPVTIDNSSRLKPDLSAPGTAVRSSLNNSPTSYGTLSGTSMATPHVAGAVALLWSAQPSLRNDVAATETILNDSAAHILSGTCNNNISTSPNNTYGNGRLDIKSAVDRALLNVIELSSDGDAITVTFYAGSGHTYRLEWKLNVTDADWSSVTGVSDYTSNSDGPAQLTDPNGAGNAQGFYRVRMLQ